MFIIHMPKIGDSTDCKINGEPARVTWRDKDTLVIGENDTRKIITSHDEGGLLCFICGDADSTEYGVDVAPDGGGFIAYRRKPC